MCSKAIARFLRFRIFLTISSILLPRIGSETVSSLKVNSLRIPSEPLRSA
jgi:hypothetical protein